MRSALLKLSPIARALQTVNTACVSNKDDTCATDEKAAFNDSNYPPDALFQCCWISDWTKAAVENAITAVSDERLAQCRLAKPRGGTDRFESPLSYFEAKGDNFHRNWCTRTKPIHHLQTIHDDCEASARGGNDL